MDLTEAKARGLEEVMRALDQQAREMIAERDKLWEAVRALETENELSQAGLANNEQRGPEEGVRDGQPCEEDAVHGAKRDGLSRENAQHMSHLRTDIRSSDSRLATAEVFSATENQGIPLGFVKGAREAVVEHHATLSSMVRRNIFFFLGFFFCMCVRACVRVCVSACARVRNVAVREIVLVCCFGSHDNGVICGRHGRSKKRSRIIPVATTQTWGQ